ncbi:MAG: TIGR04282 family arsenosugar biosynthesis glycosyltransferase [Pseudomonadota bacterium]
MKPTLIVFVKEPRPGRVKTRLARDVGHVAAAHWYRRQCAALLRRLEGDPRWRLVLAVSPDAAGMASRVWPAALPRVAQGRGTLGARMARVLAAAGPGPALLIGSDIPGIGRTEITAALAALRGHDAVLGPSPDGGFWLIGVAAGRRLPGARLGASAAGAGRLEPVRWSTAHAMADTVERMAPLRIGRAPVRDDVDTLDDLRALGLPRP